MCEMHEMHVLCNSDQRKHSHNPVSTCTGSVASSRPHGHFFASLPSKQQSQALTMCVET